MGSVRNNIPHMIDEDPYEIVVRENMAAAIREHERENDEYEEDRTNQIIDDEPAKELSREIEK